MAGDSERESSHGARSGQDQDFGQELRDQPSTASAQRRADSHLTRPDLVLLIVATIRPAFWGNALANIERDRLPAASGPA